MTRVGNKKLSANIFNKIRTISTQNVYQKMNLDILMKSRLNFLFVHLSQHFGIFLVAFAHKFIIHGHQINLLKIIYDVQYGNNISNHIQNMWLHILKLYHGNDCSEILIET